MTGFFRRGAILAILCAVGTTPNASYAQNEPYVIVDGKKYQITDLATTRPDEFARIRGRHNAEWTAALKELAADRLFETEARARKQSVPEYLDQIRARAEPPAESDIDQAYERLQSGGDLEGRSSSEVRVQIREYLQNLREQEVVAGELARLKKKYGYEEYEGPILRQAVSIDDDPARGGRQAKITVIEFTDFECPFCLRSQAAARRLRQTYGDRLVWVVKDFPLSFHTRAMDGHIAANCVLRQDQTRYWKFYDALFAENRDDEVLDREELADLARSVGADVRQYETCLKDPTIRAEIEADIAQGERVGVQGTPTLFINGRALAGAVPYEEYERLIEAELK